MLFERICYTLDEALYPPGIRVISGGSRTTRAALFEEEHAKAYQAGWTCVRSDGSKNLLKPALRALHEESTSTVFFIDELAHEGASAFEKLLTKATAFITHERYVSIVVSGEEWIDRLLKASPASPGLTQSAMFIDGETQPLTSVRGEAQRAAKSRFITGGSSAERRSVLLLDIYTTVISEDWKFIHVLGNEQIDRAIDDAIGAGEPVAMLVEELDPDNLESAVMALTKIAKANQRGAKITLSVSGERNEIEALFAAEDAQLLETLELVDLDQHPNLLW